MSETYDWRNRLRTATAQLTRCINDVTCGTTASPVQSQVPTIRLMQAVSDISQLHEKMIHDVHAALRGVNAWKREMENRLASLEVDENAMLHSGKGRKRRRGAEYQSSLASVRSPASHSVNSDVQPTHQITTPSASIAPKPPSPPAPTSQPSPAPAATPPIVPTPLPPPIPSVPPRRPSLPTLRDVEQDLLKRRQQTRQKRAYKPLPCEKCRLRKRAMLLRQTGTIKEQVYERWVTTPGNCLPFMHMGEKLPSQHVNSPFSFEETQTQTPEKRDEGQT